MVYFWSAWKHSTSSIGISLQAVAAAHADVRAPRRSRARRPPPAAVAARVRRPALRERGAQLLGADRLQQIGDGLGLEGLQRVFVEGGGEDHRRRLGQMLPGGAPPRGRRCPACAHRAARCRAAAESHSSSACSPFSASPATSKSPVSASMERSRSRAGGSSSTIEYSQAHVGSACRRSRGWKREAQRHDVFVVEAAGLHRGAFAVHEIEAFA